jgi:hypothetical protein
MIGAMGHCLSPYDFTAPARCPPKLLDWAGIIARTDGEVNWQEECMSTGYAVGAGPVPDEKLAVRVSVSVVPSLHCVPMPLVCSSCSPGENPQASIIVFRNSLVLLDILQKRAKANFNPRPSDIIH